MVQGSRLILEEDPGFSDRALTWLKGLAIAAAGAALTYISAYVTGTDFGSWTPVVVAAWSAAVNALRKFFPEVVVTSKQLLRLK